MPNIQQLCCWQIAAACLADATCADIVAGLRKLEAIDWRRDEHFDLGQLFARLRPLKRIALYCHGEEFPVFEDLVLRSCSVLEQLALFEYPLDELVRRLPLGTVFQKLNQIRVYSRFSLRPISTVTFPALKNLYATEIEDIGLLQQADVLPALRKLSVQLNYSVPGHSRSSPDSGLQRRPLQYVYLSVQYLSSGRMMGARGLSDDVKDRDLDLFCNYVSVLGLRELRSLVLRVMEILRGLLEDGLLPRLQALSVTVHADSSPEGTTPAQALLAAIATRLPRLCAIQLLSPPVLRLDSLKDVRAKFAQKYSRMDKHKRSKPGRPGYRLVSTHPQQQSVFVGRLPVELLGLVFKSLEANSLEDISCGAWSMLDLALSCQRLYELGYRRVNAALIRAVDCTGDRLIIVGDESESFDLPSGMFSSDELAELQIGQHNESRDDEGPNCFTGNLYAIADSWPMPFTMKDFMLKIKLRRWEEQARIEKLRHDSNRDRRRLPWLPKFKARIEEDQYDDLQPIVLENPVLRNLSKRQYVRDDALEKAMARVSLEQQDCLQTGNDGVGDLAYYATFWSTVPLIWAPPNKMNDLHHRGRWAGDRFDVAPLKSVEVDAEGEVPWEDVSDSLVELVVLFAQNLF
ncbi:hypothetical protein BKA62DRAFT_776966 [Auriculariales sp. MPI-PUGE-AT-0066]|nr:hypothetical protein BKA62DRAFT_776966 [Auriculariales sp. MPI-PUGE-AT-0066]